MDKVICEYDLELQGKKYKAYLKEIPTKIAVGGAIEKTTARAFIKKI